MSVKTSLEPGTPPAVPIPGSPSLSQAGPALFPPQVCGARMGRNPSWGTVGACQALERGQGLCLTWHRLAPAIPFGPHLGLAGGASPQFCIRTWPFPSPPLSYWVLGSLSLPPLHTHLSWTQRETQEQDGLGSALSLTGAGTQGRFPKSLRWEDR